MKVVDRRGMLTVTDEGPQLKPRELLERLIELGELPADAVLGHLRVTPTADGHLYRFSWLTVTSVPGSPEAREP